MTDRLAPGTRLGPYEVGDLIGAGGMGQVYRARDPRLDRQVAIKTLSGQGADHPDRIRRFESEAKAAGTLDHPNLLTVYDVGRDASTCYIVSELLEGETLRDRLRRGALTERQTVEYAIQIADGLAAAHARAIVHRDLKPENLFLTRDRRLKILDFGVAKLNSPDNSDAPLVTDTLTVPGIVVGTVGYMAPEQVRGQSVDHRADIFALGVVMHEMLSGAAPFRRGTAPETLTAILNDEVPEVPGTVTPALAAIIRRCLEKAREDRFHSAHDLSLALGLLTSTTSTAGQAAAASTTTEAARVTRRTALRYGTAAGLGLLASGVAGGVALERRMRRPASLSSFQRLTFRRGLVRSARVAPDGKTILYGALWDGDRCRIYSGRLDSAESAPLDLPNANVLAISRSGEIALALGPHHPGVVTYGTLARVPLTGGAPRPLLEDVKFADWSPDGSELAIIRRVNGRDRLEFPVGTPLVQTSPSAPESEGLGFPRVSPDGRHVAFVQYQSLGLLVGHVAITDRAGRVTQLSDEYPNIHGLAWKADEIWYTAADVSLFRALRAVTPEGTRRTIARMPGNPTLWDASPDGRIVLAHTDDRSVVIAGLSGDAAERDLSWLDASYVTDLSRDGRLLLFNEVGQGGGPQPTAYLRGTDGSPAIRLGTGFALALSPDARWAIGSPGALPSPTLEIIPTGAGDVRRVPGQNGMLFIGAYWLPDGDRFVVSAFEAGRQPGLYLLELGKDQLTPLTPAGLTGWVVSPDGSMIAAKGPSPAIRLYPIDGSPARDLPGMTGKEYPEGWTSHGLLFTRSGGPETLGNVYRVDPSTGHQELWDNILPADPTGIMGLSSFRVTPDGQSRAYTWHRALSNLYVADGLA